MVPAHNLLFAVCSSSMQYSLCTMVPAHNLLFAVHSAACNFIKRSLSETPVSVIARHLTSLVSRPTRCFFVNIYPQRDCVSVCTLHDILWLRTTALLHCNYQISQSSVRSVHTTSILITAITAVWSSITEPRRANTLTTAAPICSTLTGSCTK